MSVPSTMEAIRVEKLGGTEVLQRVIDYPVPQLQDGQVLVRNEYIGVNYIDVYFRSGVYPTTLPFIPGREAAGVVAAVHPSVTSAKVGDRVVYMNNNYAYATYTAVPAAAVVSIPDSVSTETAAAAYLQGLTAWTFIREAGRVQPGQWVLVHAAAGGVGLQLCQMLKVVGAKVVGTASTAEKCELARAHGADHMVNSKDPELAAKLLEITGGKGFDVILDGVGKATFDLDLQVAARLGSVISYGNASGVVPPFAITRLGQKNLRLMRPVVMNYIVERDELEKWSGELFDLIGSGKVKCLVYKTYALKDVAQAHSDLEGRVTTGKLLLKA